MDNNILVVIPARGGSKGLPGKNIKDLCGKPLIAYSIDVARAITSDENICVSGSKSHRICSLNSQINSSLNIWHLDIEGQCTRS